MMNFLRKILAPPAVVEPRIYDTDTSSLEFRCEENLEPGPQEVRFLLEDEFVKLSIDVVHRFPDNLYVSRLLGPPQAKDYLPVLFPKPEPLPERRSAPRVKRRLRISSHQLPGFIGITSDFSISGVRFNCDGPVKRGEQFRAEIEFDDETMSVLEIDCEAVWCVPGESNRHAVGARFQNLSPAAAARVAYLVEDLLSVEEGVLRISDISG